MATWRATRFWILLAVAAGLCFFALPKGSDADMTETEFTLNLLCFVVLGISMCVVIFAVRRLYRCPRCNNIPMSGWGTAGPYAVGYKYGVDLNPSICTTCHAKLRADD
jgi:hypothetical protein